MAAPVARMASATLSGVRPPESMNGNLVLDAQQRAPVEGRAVAAGTRAVGRGAGVEQDEVGGLAVAERARARPAAVSTLIAFMTGVPQRRRMSAARSGVSSPCSWIRSGAAAATTVSISASSGSTIRATILARPRALSASALAAAGAHVARARREEHEADVVGAARQRRLERGLASSARRS